MAAKRKVRKAYNANARKIKYADSVCRGAFIMCVHGLANRQIEWVMDNRPQVLTKANYPQAIAMFETSRPWSLVVGTVCRDQLGNGYIKYESITLRNRFAFSDRELTTFINQEVDARLAEINTDHLLSPFFIAQPERIELTDSDIKKLIEWKRVEQQLKTPYELNKMRAQAMDELDTVDPTPYADKVALAILSKHGITSYKTPRKEGFAEIGKIKGIGRQRLESLMTGYVDLLNDPAIADKIPTLIEFETYLNYATMALENLKKPIFERLLRG